MDVKLERIDDTEHLEIVIDEHEYTALKEFVLLDDSLRLFGSNFQITLLLTCNREQNNNTITSEVAQC